MSSTQRIVILVVAVVVLAGGFVVARGSDDDDGGASVQRPAAETVAEGTGGAEAPAETTGGADAATGAATTEAPPPRVETIRIAGGRPASGEARTVTFEDGETIRLRFRSDAASEVHIHGYDKYVNVPAGGSARTRFKADAQGVFEIEDHGTGALLAKLEVRP